MPTSTVVIIGVVVAAGVGGFAYWQYSKAKKAAAAAKKSKSTVDKVVGSISSLIPVASSIAALWA
jgi:predicted negative regulator of RcsB-dependent stress response